MCAFVRYGPLLSQRGCDICPPLRPGKPHPHTFKLYDKNEKPYCCDYVFVTPELAPRLRAIRIDSQTQASDHQPVMVELG